MVRVGTVAFFALFVMSVARLSAQLPAGDQRLASAPLGTELLYVDPRGLITERVISKMENRSGKLIYTIQRKSGGDWKPDRILEVSEKGILLVATGSKTQPIPVMIFKLPFKAGDSWNSSLVDPQDQKWNCRSVSRPRERIKVPAGEFDAYPVDTDYRFGDRAFKHTCWFALDVGIIQESYNGEVFESLQATRPKK